jgi:hypothetical protein
VLPSNQALHLTASSGKERRRFSHLYNFLARADRCGRQVSLNVRWLWPGHIVLLSWRLWYAHHQGLCSIGGAYADTRRLAYRDRDWLSCRH